MRSARKEAAARDFLLRWLRDDDWIQKGKFTEEKEALVIAAIDVALVSAGVRSACLFALHKKHENVFLDGPERVALGVEVVRMQDDNEYINGSWFTVMVIAASSKALRRVALDHKACFPKEGVSTAECDKVFDDGRNFQEQTGKALGYVFPGSDFPITGGLSFVVRGLGCLKKRSGINIMGPQSVDLSDPALMTYAIDVCKRARAALIRILPDQAKDADVFFAVRVD